MQAIPAGRLLDGWDSGRLQHPLHRALTLLRIAEPDQTIDSLACLTIGERDRRLLALRRRLFGGAFEAAATCVGCHATLEVSFAADQLLAGGDPRATADVVVDGRTIALRQPNTEDLLDALAQEPGRRATALLERCAGADVLESARDRVQQRMADIDPMALVEMQLTCPDCRIEWIVAFDIASYLWAEVSDRAMRLLRDVNTLARAYGWSEADILTLAPRRRQMYLELVNGA
jgi:hypothetical protein